MKGYIYVFFIRRLGSLDRIYNTVNMHTYHYAGNNPVKYVVPDVNDFYNNTNDVMVVRNEDGDPMPLLPD